MDLNNQEKFTLFVIGLAVASFLVVSFVWSATPYYVDAYRKPIQDSKDLHRQLDEASSGHRTSRQPDAHGISESDIHKSKGNRYEAF